MYLQFALSHTSYETDSLALEHSFQFLITFSSVSVCACVCTQELMCHGAWVWSEENLQLSVLSLLYGSQKSNSVRLAIFSHWAIRPGLWHSSTPCIYFIGLHSVSADRCYKPPNEVLLYTVRSCIHRNVTAPLATFLSSVHVIPSISWANRKSNFAENFWHQFCMKCLEMKKPSHPT